MKQIVLKAPNCEGNEVTFEVFVSLEKKKGYDKWDTTLYKWNTGEGCISSCILQSQNSVYDKFIEK